MNAHCQIEYGYSDSDIAMPCGNPAVGSALTAELRSVPTVELGVAVNRSVSGVVIITLRIRA